MHVVRRWILGSIAFGDYPTGNGESYSVLEFLQPSFYDELEIENFADDLVAQKPQLVDLIRSPKKECKNSTNYDEG